MKTAFDVMTQTVPTPNVIPRAKARNATCTLFWKMSAESAADPRSPGPGPTSAPPASRIAWRAAGGKRPACASWELATHRSVASSTTAISAATTAMKGSVRRNTAR